MTARPMTERPLSDEEWAAMTDEQWLQHRIARCAAEGWTANKERYERLLSTSSAERGMREALIQARQELWDALHSHMSEAEFNKEVEYIDAALSARAGEDEQARGQGRSASISTDTKGTTK